MTDGTGVNKNSIKTQCKQVVENTHGKMGIPDLPKTGSKLSPRGFTILVVSQSNSFKRACTRDRICPRSWLLSLYLFSYLLASSVISSSFSYQQRFLPGVTPAPH